MIALSANQRAGFFFEGYMADNHTPETQKEGRTIAITIAIAGLLSILAPGIVDTLGLEPRYEILIYLFSLAAFVWALVVTWKLWQKTRSK